MAQDSTLTAVALTGLALGASCALADPAPQTLPKIEVEGVQESDTTHIGKYQQAIRDVPQTITVINREVLDSQGASTLVEALRNVPGITISAGEGGQIGDNINLRGFSARTDIYLDGFRDRGQYSRDTFFLDAVEVLKGPSSMLFGRGSTGGVINQSSKRPTLQPISEITAAAGGDDYYRSTFDFGRPLSEISAFRVALMAQDIQSSRDVVHNKDYGAAPSLRFGINTPTEITLSALIQRNNDVPDYGFPLIRYQGQTVSRPVDAPANNFYGFANDRYDQNVTALNSNIRHQFNSNWTLRNQTQYVNYRTDAAPTPLGGLVNPVTGAALPPPAAGTPLTELWYIRQTRDRVVRDTTLYNQTDVIGKIHTGSVLHTTLFGVEIGRDEYKNNFYTWTGLNGLPTAAPGNVTATPAVNLGDPLYADRPPVSADTLRLPSSFTETTADTLAVYANDQIDLNTRWKLVAGLRWDRFSADQTALTYAYAYPIAAQNPSKTLTQVNLTNNASMLSTRAGLIYQPSARQSYYASYGTSFNPSAEALTLAANNTNLDPEKNRSYEVGAKWTLSNGGLMLNAALFRIEKTNARTVDPLDSTLQTLAGNIRVDGVESGVVGHVTENWTVIGGYTFLNGKILQSNDVATGLDAGIRAQGKVPQNTPRHSATLWSTYRVAQYWELGGGLLYSSDRFVNNFQTAVIDGYTRADAGIAYLRSGYDIRLNLQNLTDKKYFETASGGRATPVTGRRAIVTFSYRF